MKRFLSDAALTALAHAVTALTLIAAQAWFARQVTLEDFGRFAAAQALVLIVEAAIVARSGEVALQFIGEHWHGGRGGVVAVAQALRTSEFCWHLAAAGAVAIAALVAGALTSLDADIIAVLAIALPLQAGYGVSRSLFVIADRLPRQLRMELLYSLLYLTLVVALTARFGLWGMVAAVLCAALLRNLLAALFTRDLLPGRDGATRPDARRLRSASGHAIARNLLANAGNNVDVVLLGSFAGAEAAGLYRAAKTLAGAPLRIAAPAWVALRPRLLPALHSGNPRAAVQMIAGVGAALLLLSLLLLLLLSPIAQPLIALVYGLDFAAARLPFMILFAAALLTGAVTGWLSFAAVLSQRKATATAVYALQLLLLVACALWFGRGSPEAMAGAVAVAGVVTSLLAWWLLLSGRLLSAPDAVPPADSGREARP